jgi:hypothetical protein
MHNVASTFQEVMRWMRSMEKGVGERNLWCGLDGCDHDLTKSRLTSA